jgi:hypothetical protein
MSWNENLNWIEMAKPLVFAQRKKCYIIIFKKIYKNIFYPALWNLNPTINIKSIYDCQLTTNKTIYLKIYVNMPNSFQLH